MSDKTHYCIMSFIVQGTIEIDMFSFHKQRIWGNIIEVFKILNNFDKINPEVLFEMNNVTVTASN